VRRTSLAHSSPQLFRLHRVSLSQRACFFSTNPPFSLIAAILRHFFRCKIAQPIGTALLLLVPVWDKSWYRVIKSTPRTFRLVRSFGPNSDLFTVPPFPASAARGRRCVAPHIDWTVEVYYVRRGPMIEEPPAEFMAGKPFRR